VQFFLHLIQQENGVYIVRQTFEKLQQTILLNARNQRDALLKKRKLFTPNLNQVTEVEFVK
jgi:hypothetical protein